MFCVDARIVPDAAAVGVVLGGGSSTWVEGVQRFGAELQDPAPPDRRDLNQGHVHVVDLLPPDIDAYAAF